LGFLEAELSVTLVEDEAIASLAGRFGRAASATDVLAFPAAEGLGGEHAGDVLGDVIVSIERAEEQARDRGVPIDDELRDLLVHGTLHVLGLDHQRASDTRAMREVEAHIRWELARLS
jgi:probable rRNA maturation factor